MARGGLLPGLLATAVLLGCASALPEIVINEFMADNATVLQAADGSFPDWIELYNNGDRDLSLDGIYITDNLATPTLWSLSREPSLASGGFLLLLADGAAAPGHVPFRLARDGEEIGLYAERGGEMVIIDAVDFGPQPEDQSSARMPDGGDEWVVTDSPTPGESNG